MCCLEKLEICGSAKAQSMMILLSETEIRLVPYEDNAPTNEWCYRQKITASTLLFGENAMEWPWSRSSH